MMSMGLNTEEEGSAMAFFRRGYRVSNPPPPPPPPSTLCAVAQCRLPHEPELNVFRLQCQQATLTCTAVGGVLAVAMCAFTEARLIISGDLD